MHEVLEEYYNSTNKDYQTNMVDKWNKYKLDGRMDFYSFKSHVENGIKLYLEVTDVEKEFFLQIGDFHFVMYLDILNKKTGHILDWKSGEYTDAKKDEYKKQVICYAYGYHAKYGEFPNRLSIFFNKNNHMEDFIFMKDFSELDVLDYEKYVVDTGKDIEQRKKNLNELTWEQNKNNCFFCGYKHMCFSKDKLNFQIKIKGTNCVLSGDLTELLTKGIVRETKFDLPNKFYIQKAVQEKNHGLKPKNFDDIGTIFQFNKYSKSFNIGLIDKIKTLLVQYSEFLKKPVNIEIIDERNQEIMNSKLGTMPKVLDMPFGLRKYQEEAIGSFVHSGGMGYIELGTGGGKTLLTAELIRQLDTKTLWIIDRKELLYQTKDVFESVLGVECGLIGDGEFDLKDVTLATIQTLSKRINEKDYLRYNQLRKFLNEINFVIVDEAHHAAAQSYIDVFSYINNAKYRLGTTGTAKRDDGMQDIMFGLIGNIIYRKSTEELIKEGYLVNGHCMFFYVPKEDVGKFDSYHEEYDGNIVNYEPRNNLIIRLADDYKDKKMIILVSRVEHGNYLESQIPNSVYIHGSLDSKLRQDYMQKFKESKSGVLIATLSIASEGLDIPDLDIIMNASGNKSDVKSIQTIGRVLRKIEDKKTGFYIDFVDVGRWTRKHSNQRILTMRQEGHTVEFK